MSGSNVLSADVVISGRQSTIHVAALPKQLQEVLLTAFALEPHDAILSVKSVQLQSAVLLVNELYVIDIDRVEESPMFACVTHIIQHEGIWSICGLLNVAVQFDLITDSYLLESCDEYVVLNVHELKTHHPVAKVHLTGDKIRTSLPYRVV